MQFNAQLFIDSLVVLEFVQPIYMLEVWLIVEITILSSVSQFFSNQSVGPYAHKTESGLRFLTKFNIFNNCSLVVHEFVQAVYMLKIYIGLSKIKEIFLLMVKFNIFLIGSGSPLHWIFFHLKVFVQSSSPNFKNFFG